MTSRFRVAVTILCATLAGIGLALGLSTACSSSRSRDERIEDLQRTVTASERRIDRARTEIAILTQTPD
jgi:hypothetical protein